MAHRKVIEGGELIMAIKIASEKCELISFFHLTASKKYGPKFEEGLGVAFKTKFISFFLLALLFQIKAHFLLADHVPISPSLKNGNWQSTC